MSTNTESVKDDGLRSKTDLTFDRDAACAHLRFMFGGLETNAEYKEGRIEIGTLDRVKFFNLDQMEAAVDYAATRSAEGSKIYVHNGLIRPDYHKVIRDAKGFQVGHSAGEGVLCWPCVFGEADHKNLNVQGQGEARNTLRLAAFRDAAERHGFRWGWVHSTGTVPSLRLQGFIRLEEPAKSDDVTFWSVVKSITHAGKLDTGANNCSQVLRLCGSMSPPGADQRKDELGEPRRVLERVERLSDTSAPVSLDTLYLGLEISDVLNEHHSTASTVPPAKDTDQLMARVKAPEGAKPLDREKVRDSIKKVILKASRAEADRRNAVLAAAKFAGGYLWTGAFEVEELWGEAVDDNDPGLSLTAAYELSGGEADNGENGLAKGLLGPLSTGAAKPWAKITNPPHTDGSAFEDPDATDPYDAPPNLKAPTQLHVIAEQSHDIAKKIVKALLDRNVDIFRRAGQLVEVVERQPPAVLHVEAGAVVAHFAPLTSISFWGLVSEHVQIFAVKRGAHIEIKVPRDVTDAILSRADAWPFREILSISTSPIMRQDGSILSTRGYDPETKIYLTSTLAMPPIPDRPDRDDAMQALEILEDLVCGFAFAAPVHRSAGIASIIAAVCRPMFPVVPAVLLSAPSPSSGKSFFIDVCSMVAAGRTAAAMAAGRDETEMEKRLDGHLLAGSPIISIDNLNGAISSDKLCMVVERQLIDVRALGRSDITQVVNTFSCYLNGNNPSLSIDMARRVITVRLEPPDEIPELRKYPNRPVEMVQADRGRFVAAAFTIIKAWRIARAEGTAKAVSPRLSSFETWSDSVRSALIWLDREDPCGSMLEGKESDPQRQADRDLVVGWFATCGAVPCTIAEALAKVDAVANLLDTTKSVEVEADGMTLRTAIDLHMPAVRSSEQSLKLGHTLRRLKGVVLSGLKVQQGALSRGSARWQVVPVE